MQEQDNYSNNSTFLMGFRAPLCKNQLLCLVPSRSRFQALGARKNSGLQRSKEPPSPPSCKHTHTHTHTRTHLWDLEIRHTNLGDRQGCSSTYMHASCAFLQSNLIGTLENRTLVPNMQIARHTGKLHF